MYLLRLITVSLACFAFVYAVVFTCMRAAWPALRRHGNRFSPRTLANILLSLQIGPVTTAASATAVFVLPSFLRLEPHATDEGVGAFPVMLALFATTVLVAGSAKAFSSWRSSQRSTALWKRDSRAAHLHGTLRAYRAQQRGLLAVTGLHKQKLFVSEDIVDALAPEELQRAIAHEMIHVRRHDNLAKLLVTFCDVLGTADVRRAWLHALELTADEGAVTTTAEALDLASALVKVSRLTAPTLPDLATGFADAASGPLSERVQRLITWSGPGKRKSWTTRLPFLTAVVAGAITVAIAYHSIILQTHSLTEWLVR